MVKGLLAVAGNTPGYGKTYHFSGGQEISIRELAGLMLKHAGLKKPIVPIPLPICRLAALIMEKTLSRPPLTRYAISRILHDAAPDHAEARQDLGYDPVGVAEGLQRCYPLEDGSKAVHERP